MKQQTKQRKQKSRIIINIEEKINLNNNIETTTKEKKKLEIINKEV